MAQILVIEDNETMRDGIVQILARTGHDAKPARGGREGLTLFDQYAPDFVITDLKMEDMDGMAVLRKIKELSPEAVVMVITAFGTIETAVEAMKLGAFDFITKPFPPDLLRVKVTQALDIAKMKAENLFLRDESRHVFPDSMIGESRLLQNIRDQILRVAPTDSSVLITGESGTGKELVAREIHEQSKRARKPFVKVDCSALAEGVLESELFGHERGAFTGAIQRKPGRFELADGGTLFLDEVGEVPPGVQLKLLRVLQDRCFERVGGTRTLKVDVRILSATNKNLLERIRQGQFREDLYYRLHIVPIQLPPLRERRADIPLLVEHFLKKWNRKAGRRVQISPEAMVRLQAYQWPGNIRELENLLERTVVMARHDVIHVDDLPDGLKKTNDHVDLEVNPGGVSLNDALEQLERELILKAYQETGGVKTRTAQLLGIKTSALYYKLEKYGIYAGKEE
ncbi:MAG TPA: sigma-54 dependent transcriptional regulator [Bdellovibrionota bacterium]|nr:sigma-54 dependent transcriptional regulator [Bdellovibrionota bacterium]